ncbi:MAG: phosphatidylinositol mannoside acyltransferase [Ilumatobacteraceae bacterium]
MTDADRRRLGGTATVGAYRLGSLAARLLPAPVAQLTSLPVGLGASIVSRPRRQMVERHLRRVDPSLRGNALRRAVQESFDSYARYYIESFRLPSLSSRAVDRAFTVDGFEHITAAVEAGRGCIFALPHLGGWEWAGRWMTDRGHRLTVVVEALDPPELFEWFARLRADLGMTVVPTGPEAVTAVVGALRRNEIVCLLCDRDLDRDGVPVEFFGETTTLPAGPAMLALRTGATLLPVGTYFTDRVDGHHAVVRPPIPTVREGGLRDDVARVTAQVARELEVLIRRAPTQWHLFQPNWPSDPGY